MRSPEEPTAARAIGTLNEKPLHAALKAWYAQPGDRFEVSVAGYVIDIVRGDLLIEIQTGNFAAIKSKMAALAAGRPVRLVYPVARTRWIVRLADDAQTRLSRRKSPKRGEVEDVFYQFVRFPHLLASPNFTLEVLFIEEEELRRYDATRGWRRKGWITHERRLLNVVGQQRFQTPADAAALLPARLPDPFTTADLAVAAGRPRALAQKMTYCLRAMGALTPAGKRGNAVLYGRASYPVASDATP